jgi:hypothetical protein
MFHTAICDLPGIGTARRANADGGEEMNSHASACQHGPSSQRRIYLRAVIQSQVAATFRQARSA